MTTAMLQEERVIRPKSGLVPLDFRELWEYRELFWFMTWRNVIIRYKQTALGIAWAVIQPVLTMVVFTVIFGRLAKFPSGGVPYPVMAFIGVLPWQFFANALTMSSNSLVASRNMVSKIYFPRLIIPTSAVLAGVVDFAIAFSVLVGLILWYHVPLRIEMLMIPLFFLLAFLTSFAVGLWFSALNVKYRDVKYVVPFLVRLGFYVSPVGFKASVIPEKWRFWYHLNPMAGVIEGFRWCILGSKFEPYWPGFWASLIVVGLVLVSGAYYFRYTEKTFADVI